LPNLPVVADPTQTSIVHLLIGVVEGTRICYDEGSDVILSAGLNVVFGFAGGLVVVFGFLARLGGASFG
jgi:hypothetical protein